MSADIYASNLNPNQKWFAKISDAGADALVELFNSKADAEGDVNRVAYASFEFGAGVAVILTNDTEEPDIELFTDQNTWHLQVTLEDGDDTKIVEFGPITDRPEIIDPLLVTDQACEDRARLEVDKHTHVKTTRVLTLGTHIQGLDIDAKRKLTDNMRGLNQQARVDNIQIRGNKDSLVDIVTVTEFEDASR